jgi:endonuclease III
MSPASTEQHKQTVEALLQRFGQTYAEQAGITLQDKPAPLFQLLVLTTLLSHRISADLAVEGTKALFDSGYRTPERMRDANWQQRVDALGRGHFRRYDESTATTLGETATAVIDRWDGDLRRLRDAADAEPSRIQELLMEFKGIGPTGAGIFLREVQAVWPQVSPYLDVKVKDAAGQLDLPTDADVLAELAGSSPQLARLASALLRVSHDPELVKQLTSAV